MATYWENSCSFGLRYVSWYKYLIVSLVFSHLGFWSGNLFLIAPFPDLCLLVPSWYKYLIVSLVFSHLGFWSGNLFLIAPFPDLCLLVPFFFKKMCFNNIWSRMDIPLYGLCVGFAKDFQLSKEAMPDRPVHKQNRLFARGACFQRHAIFKQLSE